MELIIPLMFAAVPFFCFFAFAGLVIFLIIYNIGQTKKRREDLGKWSSSRGLRFSADKDFSMDERYRFACLRRGDDRYAYNISQGKWEGRSFLGFDYHYETESTDSDGDKTTHNHNFSAVIIECDVPMKPLTIREENILDKLAGFFGFNDIDFESAAFSDQFKVGAEDRKWTYAVLHARTIEFLLKSPRFNIEFTRDHAIAYRGSRFDVAEYDSAVAVLVGILNRLPEYVREQRTDASS